MVFEQVLKADMYYSGMLRRVHSEAGCLYRRPLHEITREAQQGFLLKMGWRCQGDFTLGCWWTGQGKRERKQEKEKKVWPQFLTVVSWFKWKMGHVRGSGLLVFFCFLLLFFSFSISMSYFSSFSSPFILFLCFSHFFLHHSLIPPSHFCLGEFFSSPFFSSRFFLRPPPPLLPYRLSHSPQGIL